MPASPGIASIRACADEFHRMARFKAVFINSAREIAILAEVFMRAFHRSRSVSAARWLLVVTSAACATAAHSDQDSCLSNALPPTLPLSGQFTANTCMTNQNPACNATPYDYTTSTTLLTLDQASSVTLTLGGTATFQPAGYLSGGICNDGSCGPELPAGNYCLTVAPDPSSAIGTCGCFMLLVESVAADPVFANGFD
jgi:hypothetical protein